MTQEAPFSIQIEPTEGCTLACSFCALQSIRDNGANADKKIHGRASTPFKFMTVELATRIASEIHRLGWNPRIEFAMHGEPTSNPKLAEIIEAFREVLPKVSLMLTTNGSGLLTHDAIDRVFMHGLNTLAFDNYKHAQWRERTRKALEDYGALHHFPVFQYPANTAGNPHQRFHKRRIVIISDISDATDGTHTLTNQGGNSFAGVTKSLQERCAKPFRELAIRWDGNVAICCDDWQGQYKIGSVATTPLDEVWQHPRFNAARQFLFIGERYMITPCNGCNVRTYRNGLLPDKKGKQPLEPPTSETMEFTLEALDGPPFSVKV